MDTWEPLYLSIAVTALLVAIVALMRWRRAARIMGTRVLIGEAMMRRGITPADAEAAGLEPEIVLAGKRCAVCAADAACRVVLSESGRADVPDVCPNRNIFDRIAQHKAVAGVARPNVPPIPSP
jgi:Family of unknown function (DUF6455)